jgi:hypothetical protein
MCWRPEAPNPSSARPGPERDLLAITLPPTDIGTVATPEWR